MDEPQQPAGPEDPEESRGDRIKRLRLKRGMTRHQLAVASGAKSEAQIAQNEDKNARPGNIADIAAVLGTTVGYLDTGEEAIPGPLAEEIVASLQRIEASTVKLEKALSGLQHALAPGESQPRKRAPRRSK